MRDKLRLYLFKHERIIFRCMVFSMWIFMALGTYAISRDPVGDFLSGKSNRLDDYCIGPVMSGTK